MLAPRFLLEPMRTLPLLSLVLALLLFFVISGTATREYSVSAGHDEQASDPGGFTELEHIARANAEVRADAQELNEQAPQTASFSELRGRLVNEDGQPLASAALEFVGRPSPAREHAAPELLAPILFEAFTDDSGSFALQFNSPPVFEWELQALSLGRAHRNWNFEAIDSGVFIDLGAQAMHESGSISGHVTDSNGEPARLGWTLHAWNMDANFGAYERVRVASVFASDSTGDGTFDLEGLSPGTHGLYVQLDTGEWLELPPVSVRSGEVAEVKVELPTQGRGRTVVVHMDASGFSIPRSTVSLVDEFGATRQASSNGRVFAYEHLPQGRYRVTVDDSRFEPAQLSNLEPGEPAALLELVGSAALRFDVFDSHKGTRIRNWSLRIAYGARPQLDSQAELTTLQSEWMTPRVGGLFEGIVPERLWLVIGAHGYADRTIALNDLRPMETRTLNVPLESSTRVTGFVRTTSGQRCAQAKVWLMRNDRSVAETGSDSNGWFSFDSVEPGEYSLTCDAGGGRRATLEPFQLKAGNTPEKRILEVTDGFWLSGVIRAREFRSLDRCELLAWRAESEEPIAIRTALSNEGTFRTGPFVTGDVGLALSLPGSGFLLDLGKQRVSRDAQPVLVDLEARVPSELLVRVEVPEKWFAGLSVEARFNRDGHPQRASVPVAADGLADFGFVPPGDYTFNVRGPVPSARGEWRHASRSTTHVLSGERVFHVVEVPLISGQVFLREGDGGEPLRHGWVTLSRMIDGERVSIELRTDSRGRLRVQLPPGKYRIARRGVDESQLVSPILEWSADQTQPRVLTLPY